MMIMQSATRPMTARQVAAVAVLIVIGLGFYCLAYNSLRGHSETLRNAFGWPVINVLPFLAAYELAKRKGDWALRVAMLALACAFSLLFEFIDRGQIQVSFELVRRLPAIAIVLSLLALGDYLQQSGRVTAMAAEELPLLPDQIMQVTASGNYVLLHSKAGKTIFRAPLCSIEAALADHAFVRVHRSVLVRREAIVRIRPTDVVLADGSCVKTGARYRAAL